MDCKRHWKHRDLKAIDYLRKKGRGCIQKAGRATKEGRPFHIHGEGKVGVCLKSMRTDGRATEQFRTFIKDGMYIAAASPQWVMPEHSSAAVFEKEKEIAIVTGGFR